MAIIELSIGIMASPAHVWRCLTDFQAHTMWMTGITSFQITSDIESGLHTSFRVVSRGPFGIRVVDDVECTEWVDMKTLALEHRGAIKGHSVFLLAPIELGTRLSWREELCVPFGLLGGIVFYLLYRRLLRRTFRQDLWNLKRVVEWGRGENNLSTTSSY